MVVQSQFIEMFGTISGNTPLSLGDFFSMKAGKSIIAEDIKLDQEEDLYPCYGGNGVRGYVTSYTHEGDTVLIGRQGALCGNVQIARNKFYATEHAVVVTPKTPVNISWLYYALKSMELNQYARGVAQPGLAVGQLEKLPFVLPSMKSQNEFARVSHQADKSKFGGLKSQFIEMFGVLQDNTKGFPQKKLGEIAFVTKLAGFEYTKYVKYKPQGDIIMVRGLNCKQGKLILDDIYWIDKETSNFLNRSQLSKGDIVLTYVGTVGEVALIEEDNKYHLAPNVAKISLYNKTENNPEYWTYALLFSRDYVTHFAASTTQAAISMEKIRDILFPIPDYQRQCAFVPLVHQADKSKYLS